MLIQIAPYSAAVQKRSITFVGPPIKKSHELQIIFKSKELEEMAMVELHTKGVHSSPTTILVVEYTIKVIIDNEVKILPFKYYTPKNIKEIDPNTFVKNLKKELNKIENDAYKFFDDLCSAIDNDSINRISFDNLTYSDVLIRWNN